MQGFRRKAQGSSLIVVLVAALAGTPAASAAQYSPPWAHVFSFAYPGDSTGDSLNTRTSGQNAVSQLDGAGYDGRDSTTISAYSALVSYGGNDAVWAHFGHSRAGAALFWNGSAYSEVMADANVSKLNSNWAVEYIKGKTTLKDIRHMAFAACNTADSAAPSAPYPRGNLMIAAESAGVDSSIGFYDLVYWPPMNWWARMYFERLRKGDTVSAAAASARDYVLYATGAYFGTDLYSVRGGSTKLVPAAYGTG